MTTTTELRKLAEAATNGPWQWDGDVCNYDPEQEAPWLVSGDIYPAVLSGQIKCSRPDDAAYIAAANPTKVIELLDTIEAQAKQIANLDMDYYAKCKELELAHESYVKQIEALQADAERYRWLRDNCAYSYSMQQDSPAEHGIQYQWQQGTYDERDHGIDQTIDAAIDAAHKGNV